MISKKNIKIIEAHYSGEKGIIRFLPNIFAVNGIFLVEKDSTKLKK